MEFLGLTTSSNISQAKNAYFWYGQLINLGLLRWKLTMLPSCPFDGPPHSFPALVHSSGADQGEADVELLGWEERAANVVTGSEQTMLRCFVFWKTTNEIEL